LNKVQIDLIKNFLQANRSAKVAKGHYYSAFGFGENIFRRAFPYALLLLVSRHMHEKPMEHKAGVKPLIGRSILSGSLRKKNEQRPSGQSEYWLV
jgi:hypothetical protein